MGINKGYQFLQMHFHTPSEHTIDGEKFDAELHFVMNRTDSDFAVLGVFFDIRSGWMNGEDDWLLTDLNLDDLSDYHDLDLIVE